MAEATYDDLVEDYMVLSQCAGEIEAEHRSECAAFGDSWPGAAIQVDRANRAAREAKRRMEAHPEHAAWLAAREAKRAEAVAYDASLDEDIPF